MISLRQAQVVASKLQRLDGVLRELRSLGNVTVERLEEEWLVRRAVERDLQIAVEVMIDVCHRVLAIKGLPPAAHARAALLACQELGMLARAEKYRPLVDLRDFLVNELEVSIAVQVVNVRLDDLEEFRDEVLAYIRH